MNLKRILYTDFGQKLLSIVLGLGLATLFRKVCKGRKLHDIQSTTVK